MSPSYWSGLIVCLMLTGCVQPEPTGQASAPISPTVGTPAPSVSPTTQIPILTPAPMVTGAASQTAPAARPAAIATATRAATSAATAELRRSRQALAGLKSYRAFATIRHNQVHHEETIAVVPPDRSHTIATNRGATEIRETIRIKDDVWARNAPGEPWRRTALAVGAPASALDNLGRYFAEASQAALGEPGSARSGACQWWENRTAHTALCVGIADRLPYRFVDRANELELELFDFDTNIAVEPPPDG
ncbi:MAG: hypothetical protein HY329_05060 [Chloroflexi bacterium]|nr:hypothetical protein [Chloroflexota bacterium]